MFKKNLILLLLGLVLLTPNSLQAITVGPVKLEYSVNPGDVIEGEVFVENEEKGIKTFYPVFERFTEEDGIKSFAKEESDLSTWFKIVDSVTLPEGGQKRIPFRIEVPQDASPGGHFAVMWWSTAPSMFKAGEQVAIVTRAGILVYLRVSGDIKESAEILDFSSEHKSFFLSQRPFVFNFLFKNNGNVHLKPQGEILMKNILGKTRESFEINPFGIQTLPQSKKTYQVKWEPKSFVFGLYRAELSLRYGEAGIPLNTSFWSFIYDLKSLIIFGSLVMLLLLAPFGIKKYNQWIIRKATRGK